MNRREFLSTAASVAAASRMVGRPLVVPVHQVIDARPKQMPALLKVFEWTIWPEAVRDFDRCGIQFGSSRVTGEIRRSPGGRPVFTGLARGVINLVLTDRLPLEWDRGRGLAGVTTRYEGYNLCVIALAYAHGHQIPFVSVNTCVHELLHVLLHDVFENRPAGFSGQRREFRIDWYATLLWLFEQGSVIREGARIYLDRVGSSPANRA